MKKRMCCR